MYDAAGIRRHAGMHAALLNTITKNLSRITKEETPAANLKELLGHRPAEVLAGLVLGVVMSFILNNIV
ncbi:Divergent PAP2 family protein [compost metagenome]